MPCRHVALASSVRFCHPGRRRRASCYLGALDDRRADRRVLRLARELARRLLRRVTGYWRTFTTASIDALPGRAAPSHSLVAPLVHRTLRLNCLTSEFADLWARAGSTGWSDDEFTDAGRATVSIAQPPASWSATSARCDRVDRWLLLVRDRRARGADPRRRLAEPRGGLPLAVPGARSATSTRCCSTPTAASSAATGTSTATSRPSSRPTQRRTARRAG